MKKSVSLMSIAMVFSLMVQLFAAPLTVAAETTGNEYEKKAVPTYIHSMDNKTTTDCLFFKDIPNVAYIDPADYIKPLFVDGVTVSETKNSDGTYTITKDDYQMIVDPQKDTVYFDVYENYVNYKAYEDEQSIGGVSYVKQNPNKLQDNPNGATFELAPYHIDIREADGKVYLPMPTLADIMLPSYNLGQYYNGNIYYEYVMNNPFYDKSARYKTLDRDKSLIDYTYNELCFTIDNLYGRPQKAEVSSVLEKKSFDEMLDTYSEESKRAKNFLLSESWSEYYGGLAILEALFADGGHSYLLVDLLNISTAIDPGNLHYEKCFREALSVPEIANTPVGHAIYGAYVVKTGETTKTNAQVKSAREAGLAGYDTIKTWENGNAVVRDGDTLMYIFDHFENSVIESFKWALDYAKENNVKNFIIDGSMNGGGYEGALNYILTMITNKKNLTNDYLRKCFCTLTGNYINSTGVVDLNMDGKYDDADKGVYYDFNYAILTSRNSFSCGNLLPVLAQESGIAILGETSGGGECFISRSVTPENTVIQYSGCQKYVTGSGIGVDIGAKPDYVLTKTSVDPDTGKEVVDYSGFYDLKDIAGKVEKFYSKKKNTLKVTAGKTTVKAKELKKTKKTIRPLKIKNAKGTVTVKLVKKGSSSKILGKLKVSKKGAVTLKKGTYKKGTYKIVVSVKAAGNDKYDPVTVTKTVKVKIK